MASTAFLRRIPFPALSSPQGSHSLLHSRAMRTRAIPQGPLPQLRQGGVGERAWSVVRIRGLAGEGGASEKEETGASSSAGENGTSGAAVADSSSSSPGGSTKGFGASARPGAAKPASKDKKRPATIRRSAPEKPLLQSAPADNQISQLETAYVVSLAFLLGLIILEGIALAASGALSQLLTLILDSSKTDYLGFVSAFYNVVSYL